MDPVLYNAAKEGNADILIQRVDQLEVQVTPNKNTVLHIAAQFGQTQCVKEILHNCGQSLLCSLNVRGETCLHISAREGHTATVQALIDYAKSFEGDPRSWSTRATKDMLRMRNVEDETALYEAVRNNHLDVVTILIAEDPKFLHPPNKAKETPLYLAAQGCHLSILSKILDNMIISQAYIGQNGIEFNILENIISKGYIGLNGVPSKILENFIYISSQAYMGPDGRTALHAATISYHPECIKKLHDWKSSLIKQGDVYGWRPLHYAAWFGNVSAVKQLLDLDKSVAYLAAQADDNITALHLAASQGHLDIMKTLLSYCPDCWEMTNRKGQNILHIAVEHEKNEIIKFIFENSFSNSLRNQKDRNRNTPDLPSQVPEVGYRNKFKGNESARLNKLTAKISDYNLIIATLVATVTFAAGFTIPGGYDGNDGPNQGMAVLIRRAAFKVFVVTDASAMIFSISALFTHISASTYEDEDKRANGYRNALATIICAIGAMVVAFMTGFYVVLAHSPVLAISVIVICSLFLLNAIGLFMEAYLAVAVDLKNEVMTFFVDLASPVVGGNRIVVITKAILVFGFYGSICILILKYRFKKF
ncbi:ankyrin repeat-containing protein At5g02620-like [Cornus florida]|uniref:ankyrin repeat-containing protein At5g02620-like n=1 Tax=Cornus florida TaxID=4283 RepID=UPI00289A7309|nr:ankyrin repeat-containing protein At5g02620-like [Cornus florida]